MKNAIREIMFDLLVNGSVSEMMKTMQLGMRHDDEDIRFVAQLCADEADTIEEEGAMVADYPTLVTKCDLYAEVVTLIVDSKL